MKLSLALLLPLAVGCSTSQPQILTGRVAPGFPSAVSSVEVLKGASVIAKAPVAADGSFRLNVPAGTGYAVRLVGTGTSGLVFPRHAGGLQQTFTIRPGGVAFDLGKVFYIGNASTTTFAFHDAGSGSGATGGSCDAEDHDSSGATCVDDGDHSGGTCGTESETGDGSGGGSDAAEAPDAGDAVAEHNFPADGCADGGDNGGDDAGGSDSGSDASGSGA